MDVDEKVLAFLKLEKLEGFSFKGLMSEVFKRHDPTEMEDVFAVGTTGHVPEILEVDSSWPHPWMFFLFNMLAAFVVGIVDGILGTGSVFSGLYSLVVIVPALAVLVRRLHDTGRSGLVCPSRAHPGRRRNHLAGLGLLRQRSR